MVMKKQVVCALNESANTFLRDLVRRAHHIAEKKVKGKRKDIKVEHIIEVLKEIGAPDTWGPTVQATVDCTEGKV